MNPKLEEKNTQTCSLRNIMAFSILVISGASRNGNLEKEKEMRMNYYFVWPSKPNHYPHSNNQVL